MKVRLKAWQICDASQQRLRSDKEYYLGDGVITGYGTIGGD